MNQFDKVYIAATGMITSVGFNTQMTAAAVNAGISGYQVSNYIAKTGKQITMANIPDEAIFSFTGDLKRNSAFKKQYENMIIMSILAIQDAYENFNFKDQLNKPIPLILSLPESHSDIEQVPPKVLLENINHYSKIEIDSSKIHRLHFGRSGGLETIEFAYRYMFEQNEDFVLIGGVDSSRSYAVINSLEEQGRLLFEGQNDGFAPGEAACFLLLTKHPHFSHQKNKLSVAISPVGKGEEPGHINSEETYKGDGLDSAVKQALQFAPLAQPSMLYSSMNGESFWSKELGVTMLRNNKKLDNNIAMEHPADCLGDVGAASGTSLLALAAINLLNKTMSASCLIYCSSDGPKRSAVIIESTHTG